MCTSTSAPLHLLFFAEQRKTFLKVSAGRWAFLIPSSAKPRSECPDSVVSPDLLFPNSQQVSGPMKSPKLPYDADDGNNVYKKIYFRDAPQLSQCHSSQNWEIQHLDLNRKLHVKHLCVRCRWYLFKNVQSKRVFSKTLRMPIESVMSLEAFLIAFILCRTFYFRETGAHTMAKIRQNLILVPFSWLSAHPCMIKIHYHCARAQISCTDCRSLYCTIPSQGWNCYAQSAGVITHKVFEQSHCFSNIASQTIQLPVLSARSLLFRAF
jgi:hypothetical protein